MLALCVPLSRLCPTHSACRRTPLLRVICAGAVAFEALPPAYSDCACLPVVQDNLRLAELPADACHRIDHPSCPHRCSGGRRLPHSCMAFAVATQHFSCFPFCSLLYALAWLSVLPCLQANQQAGKGANQEAVTHCVAQTLKNMTESLFEFKIHLSQHNIGLEL